MKTEASTGQRADNLAEAGRTLAWLSRQIELGLAEVDLSLPQYRLLGLLAEGSAVSSALAQRLAVRPPSVTSVVDGLVVRGLVDRRHMEGDRRCVALALTAEGSRSLAAGDSEVRGRLQALLDLMDGPAPQAALDGLSAWRHALMSRVVEASSR